MLGTTLGEDLRIERLIGGGAYAAVYEADQRLLGRRVAVKVFHPPLAEAYGVVARLKAEGLPGGALVHPGLVRLYAAGSSGRDLAWLVMELLEGDSLAARLRQSPHPPEPQIVGWLSAICEALEAVHRLGLSHSDLKPSNLFLSSSGPKLMDAGVAALFSNAAQPAVVGNHAYRAPEAWDSPAAADGRADIYALGVIA